MDIQRNLQLKCGVCGNTNFEYDDSIYQSIEEDDRIKCTNCKKEYSPDELREVNSSLINNSLEELAKEAIEKTLKNIN